MGTVLARDTDRLTARRGRRRQGRLFAQRGPRKQNRQKLGCRVRLGDLQKGVCRLLEVVEGVDRVLFGEGAPRLLRQIGEQLGVGAGPAGQRAVSGVAATAGAAAMAVQTPFVGAGRIGACFIGNDEILPVSKQYPPPDPGPEVLGPDLGIVPGGMGQRVFDVGVFTTVYSGPGDAIQGWPLAVDHDEAVGVSPVHLVVVGEIDVTAVDSEHLAVGIKDEARFVRVLVAEALLACSSVLAAQQQVGGLLAPVGAEHGVSGSRHEDRRPPRRLLRRLGIVVVDDGVGFVEAAHVRPVFVVQPIPVMHGAVGVDGGQVVSVGVVDVAIVGVRPAAAGQTDVHRPVMRLVQQGITEQVDVGQGPQGKGIRQVDIGGVALVERTLGVAPVLGLDHVSQ